jgi:inner membrane protein
MDWLNSYGIRLLEPFSSEWFYGDTLFIIDIWLWLGLGFATWMSLHRERWGHNWRRPARIALAAMLAYIGVNWIFSMGAVTRNSDYFREGEQVIANPVPFTFWRRQMIKGMDGRYGVIDPGIESLDHATTGPEDYAKFISRLGICELTDADKQQIVATMPEAQPFLFWSRTPYVDQTEDGRIVLRDARFAGASRFEVELPEMPCTNPDGE